MPRNGLRCSSWESSCACGERTARDGAHNLGHGDSLGFRTAAREPMPVNVCPACRIFEFRRPVVVAVGGHALALGA